MGNRIQRVNLISDLREVNTNAIIKYIALNGEISRIDLANALNLSKMTITNIVSLLIEKDILIESKIQHNTNVSTTGPKPKLLAIKKSRIIALGVYASRDYIYTSLIDIAYGKLEDFKIPLLKDDNQTSFMEKVYLSIDTLLERNKECIPYIVGIGFTSVGLIDRNLGVMLNPTEFMDVKNLKVKELLMKRYEYSVFVCNEAQASGLAELLYGHGKNKTNFIYLEISNGVGTAVINNGALLTGSYGFAAESGHMCIEKDGRPCDCGNKGCVERYISVPVLLHDSNTNTFQEFLDAINNKEERALGVVHQFIEVMVVAITNVINIFDTDCIIIGHEGALLNKEIFMEIEKQVNQRIMKRCVAYVPVISSLLKDTAPMWGPSAIVFNEIYNNNLKYF